MTTWYMKMLCTREYLVITLKFCSKNYFYSIPRSQRMACKLPHYIEHWSREVDRWIYGDEDQRYSAGTLSSTTDIETRYPPFSVFHRFLQRESRITCKPVIAVRPQREDISKEAKRKSRKVSTERKPLKSAP